MIKINDTWKIERHIHGGFNLIETRARGFNKKTGKQIISTRSYFYPDLIMCSKKLIESGFNNEAESLSDLAFSMESYADMIAQILLEKDND